MSCAHPEEQGAAEEGCLRPQHESKLMNQWCILQCFKRNECCSKKIIQLHPSLTATQEQSETITASNKITINDKFCLINIIFSELGDHLYSPVFEEQLPKNKHGTSLLL
jgi:hypothetical protein